ncbi:MAG: hypothetical protein QM689_01290 [Oscillospiraceae bacterium]
MGIAGSYCNVDFFCEIPRHPRGMGGHGGAAAPD